MTIRDIMKLTEDEAKKRLNKLIDLNDYLDKFKTCGLPCLFHLEQSCGITARMSSLARIHDDDKANSGMDEESERFGERTVIVDKMIRNTIR